MYRDTQWPAVVHALDLGKYRQSKGETLPLGRRVRTGIGNALSATARYALVPLGMFELSLLKRLATHLFPRLTLAGHLFSTASFFEILSALRRAMYG